MKKRKLFIGLLLGSAIFSLAACSGSGTSTTSESTTPTSETTSGTTTSTSTQDTTTTVVAKKHTVTFNTNGGKAVDSVEVEEGGKVTRPATNPTKADDDNYSYEFVAWCSDADLTSEFDFDTEITAATTIYAKFAAVSKDTAIKMNGTKYDTITAALAAIPTSGDTSTYTITLPKGTYNENGLTYNGSATVRIVGNTATKYGADVIIKGHGADMTTEKTRNLISIQGTGDIILENLTLLSDWTRAGAEAAGIGGNTQAEVLGTDTKGNTVAYNCSFLSHQDTIRTAGKAWFYGCYIEGDVDFLWMEAAGSVALYEKCEIVTVGDETTKSYVCAPRMAISSKAGKGLVIYNSTLKEDEENASTLQSYLARSPWKDGYYSQVAYINTECTGIESQVWYSSSIPNEFDETVIGFKMDAATAKSLGYAGNNDIISDEDAANEFSGRKTILNRIYNTGKLKYEKDNTNNWDIDALIKTYSYLVDDDSSSDVIEGEVVGKTTTYAFDGTTDYSSMLNGFAQDASKPHIAGKSGSTITVPVDGKCYVEVYGYYAGTVEIKADTQGEAVMFFNNGTTSSEVLNTYTVFDKAAKEVVITAEETTYITQIVVTTDSSITETKVSTIDVSASTTTECVGVGLTLSASVGAGTATNKSVKWTSTDETVGTIDAYTGKVSFLKAGTVTFTATACDGSGVTGTYTCNPIDPKWTECEWYTTDTTVATEEGATEIGNWNCNSSAYKALGTDFTYTNLSGVSFTTKNGLKLNSSGKLSIALTKSPATLTIVIAHINKAKATPVVSCGSTTASLVSSADSADGTTTTYVYKLTSAGTWDIVRGDNSTENDPILYAHCAYATEIESNTFVTYKGGSYSATGTDATKLDHNSSSGSVIESTDEVTYDLFTYKGCKSNGASNWLNISAGGTITFKVADACTLKLYFYKAQNVCTVALGDTALTVTTESTAEASPFEYTISAGGTITITASSAGYIGALELIF